MTQAAVLFVYHDRPSMCASRLRLLRALNPGVGLFGLYGGTRERRPEFRQVEDLLDDSWACEYGDGPWRWRNIDKMIGLWHQARGHRLPWTVLFEHQADLMVAAPIQDYTDLASGPKDMLFYRKPLSFRELEAHHWPWLSNGLTELRGFFNYLHDRYGADTGFCGQNVFFTVASRHFVEEFAEEMFHIPGVVEYRSPSLALAAGYRLVDYQPPAADVECMSFATGYQSLERVLQEVGSPQGARMFHRVLDEIEPETMLALLQAANRP